MPEVYEYLLIISHLGLPCFQVGLIISCHKLIPDTIIPNIIYICLNGFTSVNEKGIL